MSVAHDASSESHTGTTGSVSEASFSWLHTPVGTPKGVLVFTYMIGAASAVDRASSVTYGGVAMTAVSGGRAVDTATEIGDCKAWYLGSGVPAGAQTIVVNRTNDVTPMYAVVATVTAAGDTEINTAGIVLVQEGPVSLTQQSVDDGSIGIDSMRYAGTYYGGSAVANIGANSTGLQSILIATTRSGNFVRETTAGQGSRLVGFTGNDDTAAVHLAVRELVSSTTAFVGAIPI